MQNQNSKPSIVLVHGAWADASGWQSVILSLLDAGYEVHAVQLPLNNFAADVSTVQRVVDAQKTPVVLVAHSFGGFVVSAVKNTQRNIQALVFFAAFAPDTGETPTAVLGKFPATPILNNLVPDSAGMLYIAQDKFAETFGQDLDRNMARVMAVTQKPINSVYFQQALEGTPLWRSVCSWFLVSAADRVINPDLERFFANRMNAKTAELNGSHVAFITQPTDSLNAILDAAESVAQMMAKGAETLRTPT